MIADPIPTSAGYAKQHFKDSSDPIFNYQDDVFLALTTAVGHAAWYIYLSKHVGDTYNIGGTNHISKEVFVEYVSEHYPDHFEWFLFHPEWL